MKESTSTLGLLPIRPLANRDEWTETYLGRAARANGIKRPWRNDLEQLRELLPATRASKTDGVPQYGDLPMPDWAVVGRAAKIRYCPLCMSESFYIRARWRLPMLEVCTIHDVWLKDDLVEPAITAGYKHGGRHVLADAALDLVLSGVSCPLGIERDHSQLTWAAFEQAVVSNHVERAREHLAWALLIEKLLDAVAASIRGPDYPTKDSRRLAHRAWWLGKYGLAPAANREGVRDFVNKLVLPAHRRAAYSCLDALAKGERRRRTILSLLPLLSLRDRVMAAAPENAVVLSCGALPRRAHPSDYISLDRAETVIGCPESMLRLFVREKIFADVRTVPHGRKKYVFIAQNEVAQCRRWFRSIMSVEEVMNELRIDRRGYWALLDSGLLRPQTMVCRTWHRRSDIADLLRRLDESSRPYPEERLQVQPLIGPWMFRRGRARTALVQVLKEIIGGALPLFRSLEGTGLSAYFVDAVAIRRLRWLTGAAVSASMRKADAAYQLPLLEI